MNDLVLVKDKETLKTIDIIVEKTTAEEKQQLLILLDTLLEIRERDITRHQKIKETLKLFKQSKAALPLLKHIKPLIWDNRSLAWKAGITLTAGVAAFMPGNAGIAALGGAIGVPLWVVIGGGYAFAALAAEKIRTALRSNRKGDIVDVAYSVINE